MVGQPAESIELRSQAWNTMIVNPISGETSTVQLKIHHLRPLPSAVQAPVLFAPPPTPVLSSYTISQPVAVTQLNPVSMGGEDCHVPQNEMQANSAEVESIKPKPEIEQDCYVIEEVPENQKLCEDVENSTGSVSGVVGEEIGLLSMDDLIEEEPQEYTTPIDIEFVSTGDIPSTPTPAAEEGQSQSMAENYLEDGGKLRKIGSESKSGIFRAVLTPTKAKRLEKIVTNKKALQSIKAITSNRVVRGRILKLKLQKISTPMVRELNRNHENPGKKGFRKMQKCIASTPFPRTSKGR